MERHNTWIKHDSLAISLLQERIAQVEKIDIALDPQIEILYAQLEDIIRDYLPFLQGERNRRLAFLRRKLDKFKVGLGHRLGRLLEALQVEASYGQSVDVKDIVATIDNIQK
ncbi:MAG: DUF3450 domain-containing protein [Desulfobacteraceae bacterium]|nr:DUF3450 domain-containing protein [Desulfobacteraceae bacterium]